MLELLILTTALFLAAHGAAHLAGFSRARWQALEKLLSLAAALTLAGIFWSASDRVLKGADDQWAGAAAFTFLVFYPLLLIRLLPRPGR